MRCNAGCLQCFLEMFFGVATEIPKQCRSPSLTMPRISLRDSVDHPVAALFPQPRFSRPTDVCNIFTIYRSLNDIINKYFTFGLSR